MAVKIIYVGQISKSRTLIATVFKNSKFGNLSDCSQWTNPFQWNLLVRVTLAQKPVMSFNDFYSLKPLTYLKMVHTNFFHGVLKNVFICFIYYKFFSRSHSFKWKKPLYFTQSSRILLDKASLTWSDKRKK